MSIKRTNLKSP